MRVYTHAVLYLGVFFCLALFSCEKKTTPPDPVPVMDTVLTEAKLTAKWEVVAFRFYNYRNDTITDKYEFIKDYGGILNGNYSDPWIASLHTTYITFKPDHSFAYTDINGGPDGYMLFDILSNKNASWVFKSPKTVELTTCLPHGVIGQADWKVLAYNAPRILLEHIDTLSMDNNQRIEAGTYIELEKQ